MNTATRALPSSLSENRAASGSPLRSNAETMAPEADGTRVICEALSLVPSPNSISNSSVPSTRPISGEPPNSSVPSRITYDAENRSLEKTQRCCSRASDAAPGCTGAGNSTVAAGALIPKKSSNDGTKVAMAFMNVRISTQWSMIRTLQKAILPLHHHWNGGNGIALSRAPPIAGFQLFQPGKIIPLNLISPERSKVMLTHFDFARAEIKY